MKLLIYVLTFECLRGFNIQRVWECRRYVYNDTGTVLGNNMARVNHCDTVYSVSFNCLPFLFNAVITIILGYSTESLRIASRFCQCSSMIPNILT